MDPVSRRHPAALSFGRPGERIDAELERPVTQALADCQVQPDVGVGRDEGRHEEAEDQNEQQQQVV